MKLGSFFSSSGFLHNNLITHDQAVSNSLKKLSTGLRINSAADNASGLMMANSLRTQSSSLKQAYQNANDAIGVAQIADNAIDEQTKIIDTVRAKIIQSAQDGQSTESRTAIQTEISKLLKAFNSIANNTSYNSQPLLSGAYVNKKFQVGSEGNQAAELSIQSTNVSQIGLTSFKQSQLLPIYERTPFGDIVLKLKEVQFPSVPIGYKEGEGIGKLSDVINAHSDKTGIQASYVVEYQFSDPNQPLVGGMTPEDFAINDVVIGAVHFEDGDRNADLVSMINARSLDTGVIAHTDSIGGLVLNSEDGRAIKISSSGDLRNLHIAEAAEASSINTGTSPTLNNMSLIPGAVVTYNDLLGRYEISSVDLSMITYPLLPSIPSDVYKIELQITGFTVAAGGEFVRIYKNSDYEAAKIALGLNPITQIDFLAISSWLDTNAVKILEAQPPLVTPPHATVLTSDSTYIDSYDVNDFISSVNGVMTFNLKDTNEPLYLETRGVALESKYTYLYTKGNTSTSSTTTSGSSSVSSNKDCLIQYNGPITVGKLKLIDLATGVQIKVEGSGLGYIGMGENDNPSQWTKNLLDIDAINREKRDSQDSCHMENPIQESIYICDSAIIQLDSIRSTIGSFQNQLASTMNNVKTTEINTKSAESEIRDVDFASESAEFSKRNLLVQSGSFAFTHSVQDYQRIIDLLK